MSVSMTTEEPSFQTVPDAPTRSAARYTAGRKPTPCTVPRMVSLMLRGMARDNMIIVEWRAGGPDNRCPSGSVVRETSQ